MDCWGLRRSTEANLAKETAMGGLQRWMQVRWHETHRPNPANLVLHSVTLPVLTNETSLCSLTQSLLFHLSCINSFPIYPPDSREYFCLQLSLFQHHFPYSTLICFICSNSPHPQCSQPANQCHVPIPMHCFLSVGPAHLWISSIESRRPGPCPFPFILVHFLPRSMQDAPFCQWPKPPCLPWIPNPSHCKEISSHLMISSTGCNKLLLDFSNVHF